MRCADRERLWSAYAFSVNALDAATTSRDEAFGLDHFPEMDRAFDLADRECRLARAEFTTHARRHGCAV